MQNWQSETNRYLADIDKIIEDVDTVDWTVINLPTPPLSEPPTLLQSIAFRVVGYYRNAVIYRTHETMLSIRVLWQNGHFASAAYLIRLLVEIWAASHYQVTILHKYTGDSPKDMQWLDRYTRKLSEGTRHPVLMPWGSPAAETPIHVMDIIRELKSLEPNIEKMYAELCESAHANQPRYLEWMFIGSLGDNWTNDTVRHRGHKLISETLSILRICVDGLVRDTNDGLCRCALLIDEEAKRNAMQKSRTRDQ